MSKKSSLTKKRKNDFKERQLKALRKNIEQLKEKKIETAEQFKVFKESMDKMPTPWSEDGIDSEEGEEWLQSLLGDVEHLTDCVKGKAKFKGFEGGDLSTRAFDLVAVFGDLMVRREAMNMEIAAKDTERVLGQEIAKKQYELTTVERELLDG